MTRRIIRFCLAAALAIFGGGTAWADNQIIYSYGDAALQFGTGGKAAETVDVCMQLKDQALVGMKVQSVRIAFPFTEQLSDASAWLSVELPTIKSGKMQDPDVAKQSFTIAEGFTEVTFAEPYTITDGGVYVGYSFSMEKVDEALKPILTTGYTSPGAFIIHSTKIYRTTWQDRYGYAGQLAVQVVLTGDAVKTNAAGVSYLPTINTKTGEPTVISFDVANHGAAGVQNVEYTVSVGTTEVLRNKADLSLNPVFGDIASVDFTLPPMESKGAYEYSVNITSVNGQPNEDPTATSTASLNVYNTLPVHRAVLEEYTGTWCGYCPRGFVGLEEMNRLFPEDFIGISYHNGDPMQITTDYPSNVEGFPDAWLDRWYQTDAFCGDEDYGTFGIDKAWKEACSIFAPAVVEVGSTWTDENTLHCLASVVFPIASEECPYEVGFALLADGLTGTGSSWAQSNYYTGAEGWPSCMDPFIQGGSKILGLVFNDVLIALSSKAGIPGSLQAPIEEDVAQTVTFDFDLSQISQAIVPADRTKLRVVALLIDTRTGAIANANKAQAGSASSTDVRFLPADASEVLERVEYFDLQGRRIVAPAGGIILRQETLRDGTRRIRKVRF